MDRVSNVFSPKVIWRKCYGKGKEGVYFLANLYWRYDYYKLICL